jgi:hypothetical protein
MTKKITHGTIPINRDSIVNDMMDTLWGLGLQIKILRAALYSEPRALWRLAPNTRFADQAQRMEKFILSQGESGRSFAIQLLGDRIARFRAGLINGWALRLTPSQVITDSTPLEMIPNSPTDIFMQGIAPPGTNLHDFFRPGPQPN